MPGIRPAAHRLWAIPSRRTTWDTMSLAGILHTVADDPRLSRALDVARAESQPPSPRWATPRGPDVLAGVDLVAPAALRPVLTAALATEPGQFVLAVTATAREAEDLAAALGSFLPANRVVCFPAWETLPHERLSPRSDTVGRRLAVLRRLAHPDPATRPPAAVRWSSRRSAACCSRSSAAWATWSRSAAGGRRRSTRTNC